MIKIHINEFESRDYSKPKVIFARFIPSVNIHYRIPRFASITSGAHNEAEASVSFNTKRYFAIISQTLFKFVSIILNNELSRLLRIAHRVLMQGVREERKQPDEFRIPKLQSCQTGYLFTE